MPIEEVTSYTWPTDCVFLAAVSIPVDDLAARLRMTIHTWHVDGLGPARGFGCRLPSGRVLLLEELEHAVNYHGAQGPAVFVDATDLPAFGGEQLVSEMLAAFNLSRSDIAGVADAEAQKAAAELATRIQAAMRRKDS